MVMANSSPFGSANRTRVLLALEMLSESYARELARLLGSPLNAIQGALRGLERDGLVAGQAVGRTRLYRIDPRYFAVADLRRYLARLSQPETDLRTRAESLRRRPRRTGKPL